MVPFRELVKADMIEDYLDFWLEVESFKKLTRGSEEFRSASRHIYRTYIKSRRLRCLTAVVSNRIRRIVTTPGKVMPSDMFNAAQAIVFDVMHEGVYFRFVETETGKHWYMDRLLERQYKPQLKIVQAAWRCALFRKRFEKHCRKMRKMRKLAKRKTKKKGKKKGKASKEKT